MGNAYNGLTQRPKAFWKFWSSTTECLTASLYFESLCNKELKRNIKKVWQFHGERHMVSFTVDKDKEKRKKKKTEMWHKHYHFFSDNANKHDSRSEKEQQKKWPKTNVLIWDLLKIVAPCHHNRCLTMFSWVLSLLLFSRHGLVWDSHGITLNENSIASKYDYSAKRFYFEMPG